MIARRPWHIPLPATAAAPFPQVALSPDLTRHEVGRLTAAALARHADRKRAS